MGVSLAVLDSTPARHLCLFWQERHVSSPSHLFRDYSHTHGYHTHDLLMPLTNAWGGCMGHSACVCEGRMQESERCGAWRSRYSKLLRVSGISAYMGQPSHQTLRSRACSSVVDRQLQEAQQDGLLDACVSNCDNAPARLQPLHLLPCPSHRTPGWCREVSSHGPEKAAEAVGMTQLPARQQEQQGAPAGMAEPGAAIGASGGADSRSSLLFSLDDWVRPLPARTARSTAGQACSLDEPTYGRNGLCLCSWLSNWLLQLGGLVCDWLCSCKSAPCTACDVGGGPSLNATVGVQRTVVVPSHASCWNDSCASPDHACGLPCCCSTKWKWRRSQMWILMSPWRWRASRRCAATTRLSSR